MVFVDSVCSSPGDTRKHTGRNVDNHVQVLPQPHGGPSPCTQLKVFLRRRFVSPPSMVLFRRRFKMYAQDLLVVVVVMTYACVAPVVIIPALMFFFMAQVVYRHQLL